MQGALSPESPLGLRVVYLRGSEQNTWGRRWNAAVGSVQGHCPVSLHGHTHSLPPHFPPTFPPCVFQPPTVGALGSALTQIKEMVLFLTYTSTLFILTPTVPGPVLTSGEPLALRAFVSSPEQQQRVRRDILASCCVPVHRALVIQQQGKGWGEGHGGDVDVLGRTNILYIHPVCTWGKTSMEWAAVEGEIGAVSLWENITVLWLFSGRQQTPPA